MNKYLICILVGVCFGSCTGSKNKKVEDLVLDEMNKKYDIAISFFGKPMIEGFPQRIENKNCSFTYSYSPDLGNLELVLLCNDQNDHMTNLLEEYEKKSIAKYYASDSCLLVVNKFVNRNKHFKIKPTQSELQLVDKECYSSLYPIPNFWHNDFTTDSTECKLPRDFNIYILEAKAGKYFDENYLSNGWFMPKKWRNGYSKGVAISEKRNAIIYWLIIW